MGEQNRPELSVVVPCYNEIAGIDELHRRVTKACRALAVSYEIVLVDDGSTDGTREHIGSIARKDCRITAINLSRNYGHQIALTAGLEFCRGKRVLVLDADLQDPPELVGGMMAKMDEGYDVVYGIRQERRGESVFKLATASAFYRLLDWTADVKIPENAGDFRLINRRALDHLNAMPERYRFIRGMVSWIGLRQSAFPYERDSRYAGVTHYPLRKMLRLAMDAMTSFSVAPLRFASHIGLISGLFGFAMLAYTLGAWLSGNTLRGWTSLSSIMLIIGSAQLLVLGIFGEYLGRIYMETKRRPLYIISEVISGSSGDPLDSSLSVDATCD
jgi:dolichol-phosphate mannosyltransferase